MAPRITAECGSGAAYRRHVRRKEPVDWACRDWANAKSRAMREARRRKREGEAMARKLQWRPSYLLPWPGYADPAPQPACTCSWGYRDGRQEIKFANAACPVRHTAASLNPREREHQ